MDKALSDLKPGLLWKHFDELRRIPRCSKNEGKAAEYVKTVAKRLNLKIRTDPTGNVVVLKPASKGKEKSPTVVLQGHLDMVCEKNKETVFDFTKDPIGLRRDGDYLYAKDTTLGADNGIGVCAALAVLEDKDLVHGPIEALFTIDEETGLTGAFNLDASMLTGKYLINLDTEEERALYVGCAGGADTKINLPVVWESPDGSGKVIAIEMSGLKGGHSGVDIHLERGNAIKLLARILWEARQEHDFTIASINAGDKHNAIPREIECVIVGPEDKKLKKKLMELFENVKKEYATVEPGMKISIKEGKTPTQVLAGEDTLLLLNLIQALPHGLLRWSPDIPGLVETSNNVAVIKTEEDIFLHLSSRSSSDTQLDSVRERIKAICMLAGAEAEQPAGYPGWLPNLQSKTLAATKATAIQLWGKEPAIKAIHAGLETGIIGKKFPGMDMVSIGPQIEHPHSPEERVKVDTVDDFYQLLTLSLKRLS
jgi:dipeptidase D